MSTLASTPTARTSTILGLGAAVTAVAVGFTAYGAHDLTEILVVAAGLVVVAGLVYGLVLPRALARESAGGTSLALSVSALLLTVPLFWSGLPLVLGVAGAVVGNAGRSSRSGSGTCIAGLVLGTLAVIGYLTIYVVDGFIFGNHN